MTNKKGEEGGKVRGEGQGGCPGVVILAACLLLAVCLPGLCACSEESSGAHLRGAEFEERRDSERGAQAGAYSEENSGARLHGAEFEERRDSERGAQAGAYSGLAEDGTAEQAAPVILTMAMFGHDADVVRQVEEFNGKHGDYQIIVETYTRSKIPVEDGVARLQREIATGKGPDLIDFGADFSTGDIVGGYTEDLWRYLEAEREEGGQTYFDNILKAFCHHGKLYALPVSFTLRTFAGNADMLGQRESWNIRELTECYDAGREGMILYPGEMKKDVLGTLLYGSLEYYVDWERGNCRFDSDEFARVLAFADRFPSALRITEDYSVRQIFYEGGAMLYPLRLSGIYDICSAEYVFGTENISYIGYPVEEGRGTVISPSVTMLAISANSGHKEAAWDFIAGFLAEAYQEAIPHGFPVCREALEKKLAENREPEYGADAEGNPVPVVRYRIRFEGEEPVEVSHITESQAESLLRLIETATLYSAGDRELYNILLEEADGYFSGDKSLEETCRVIQGRASLFVSEHVR